MTNTNQNNNKQDDIINQLTDSELEANQSWEALANNIDSDLESDNDKKSELLLELQENNKAMKLEIDKLTKIAATSQNQYIALKWEFDAYMKRLDIEKKEIKVSELKKIVWKFSKLLENFRLFLSHLDTNLSNNTQIQWLQLIYESFIGQELTQMGIFQIESLGLKPDSNLHEVLMIQEATQEDLLRLEDRNIKLNKETEEFTLKDLSGYIVNELEVWYYYFDWEKKIIIKPSKVILAS